MDQAMETANYFYGQDNKGNIYNQNYLDLGGVNYRVHPDVQFGENVKVGFGTVIEQGCKIGNNTLIAHNCVLRTGTVIGDDCMIGHCTVFEGNANIGNRVLIHAQCHITLGTIIEDDVFIGVMVTFANTRNIVHGRDFPLVLEAPVVRRAARVGCNVSLTPGVEIGDNAFIGMGSVVTKNVPAKEMWFGNPAKFIKNVPVNEWL
jgi:UDP-2-acetamido-3-amino-2,3-dideoxy-glucuronate N-acetyltransferase